jgi:protein-disulfide isomerase
MSVGAKDPLPHSALFEFKGQAVPPSVLSDNLKKQYERALTVRRHTLRDAELQFFKEADKIARLYILEKQLQMLSAEKQKSIHELEGEILAFEEAKTQDARELYEASDPSAPREGFAAVKTQLINYLNEVRRREALETWTHQLARQGEWKMLVSRPMPLPDIAEVNLKGLPSDGRQQPNAVVFVDYLCNDCMPFFVELASRVERFGSQLRPVYVPFPYSRPEKSMALARAALCSQQQNGFSAFHMAALTKGHLLTSVSVLDLARQSGLNMGDFRACYRSGEGLAELLSRAQGLARQFGLMQTPAMVYQGRLFEGEQIFEALDPLLKGAAETGQLTKR